MWPIDPAWVGFVGTAISALIAATAYAWKGWQERKRTARRVLYHLLEFHHVASRLNATATFPERYLGQIESKILPKGSKLSPYDREQFLAQMRKMLLSVTNHLARLLTQQMTETYLKSLEELAKDKPVLAYRLKGAELVDIASVLEGGLDVADTSKEPHDLRSDAFFQEVCNHFQSSFILNLEGRCRMVAFSCSLWTYLQTRHVLRQKSKHNEEAEFDRAIEQLFEGPLKLLDREKTTAPLSA